MNEALDRLGNVLYWTCSGIAVLFALALPRTLVQALQNEHQGIETIFAAALPFLISALMFWLFGRACRYVFASR